MSIYRRYVSRAGLEHATTGKGVASILVDRQVSGRTHPIYIVVPDEDAPEPPEIDFEREYHTRYGVNSARIVGPPVWCPRHRRWVVSILWSDGVVTDYNLDDLTPIEPAPERTYTAEQVREALDGVWRDMSVLHMNQADHRRGVLARLEGSDGG